MAKRPGKSSKGRTRKRRKAPAPRRSILAGLPLRLLPGIPRLPTWHLPMLSRRRRIALALQGGGSHGAFTWGVLERLLEEDWLQIDAISGASAGAMNGAVLISGYLNGGRDAARANLERLWRSVHELGRLAQVASNPLAHLLGGALRSSLRPISSIHWTSTRCATWCMSWSTSKGSAGTGALLFLSRPPTSMMARPGSLRARSSPARSS